MEDPHEVLQRQVRALVGLTQYAVDGRSVHGGDATFLPRQLKNDVVCRGIDALGERQRASQQFDGTFDPRDLGGFHPRSDLRGSSLFDFRSYSHPEHPFQGMVRQGGDWTISDEFKDAASRGATTLVEILSQALELIADYFDMGPGARSRRVAREVENWGVGGERMPMGLFLPEMPSVEIPANWIDLLTYFLLQARDFVNNLFGTGGGAMPRAVRLAYKHATAAGGTRSRAALDKKVAAAEAQIQRALTALMRRGHSRAAGGTIETESWGNRLPWQQVTGGATQGLSFIQQLLGKAMELVIDILSRRGSGGETSAERIAKLSGESFSGDWYTTLSGLLSQAVGFIERLLGHGGAGGDLSGDHRRDLATLDHYVTAARHHAHGSSAREARKIAKLLDDAVMMSAALAR